MYWHENQSNREKVKKIMWVWERKLSQKLSKNGCTNIISLKEKCYLNNHYGDNFLDDHKFIKKSMYLHENQSNRERK